MITLFSRQRASALALGIALATGTATVATAVFPTEASAQRNRDRDRGDSDGGGYSSEFRAVYVPIEEAVKDQAADLTPYRAQFFQLGELMNTNDEKYAGGSMIFNAGIRMQDQQLQLLGMEAMIASGMVPVEQTGRYNFIAYQLSNAAGDLAKARQYLQGAINYNFTTDGIDAPALQITMAENYFSSGEYAQGFTYFDNAVSMQKSRNAAVDENWYQRGISVAYRNDMPEKVYEIAYMWVAEYPSDFSWRETINLTRNLNEYSASERLDLLRLNRKLGLLDDEADVERYVEAADPRLLPQEVSDVVREAQAAGVASSGNLYLEEALQTATTRIGIDRRELADIERDANAADASVRFVGSTGNTFMSYGDYAKAITFYERAMTMPGVDEGEILTRLGIAQIGAGDMDAARATFEKVGGNRATIARLWLAYIDQETAGEAAPSLSDLLG